MKGMTCLKEEFWVRVAKESLVRIGDCDTLSGSPSRRGHWAKEISLLAGVWSVSLGVCPRLDGFCWVWEQRMHLFVPSLVAAAGEGSPLP